MTDHASPDRSAPAVTARTVVTWAGAGLLLGGAVALAVVVWRESGDLGRSLLLLAGTLATAALVPATRRRAPVTSEALVVVALGLGALDWALLGRTSLRPEGFSPFGWWALGATVLGVVAIAAGGGSRAARLTGAVLVVAAVPGWLTVLAQAPLAAATLTVGVTAAAAAWSVPHRDRLVEWTVLGAAGTAWLVQLAVAVPGLGDSAVAAAVLSLAVAPVLARGHAAYRQLVAGVLASIPLVLGLLALAPRWAHPWTALVVAAALVLGIAAVTRRAPGRDWWPTLAGFSVLPGMFAACTLILLPPIELVDGASRWAGAGMMLLVGAVPTAAELLLRPYVPRPAQVATRATTTAYALLAVTLAAAAVLEPVFVPIVPAVLAVALLSLARTGSPTGWAARITGAGALALTSTVAAPLAAVLIAPAEHGRYDLEASFAAPRWAITAAVVLAALAVVLVVVARQSAESWAPLPAPRLPVAVPVVVAALAAVATAVALGLPHWSVPVVLVATASGLGLLPGLRRVAYEPVGACLAVATALAALPWVLISPTATAITLALLAVLGTLAGLRAISGAQLLALLAALAAPLVAPAATYALHLHHVLLVAVIGACAIAAAASWWDTDHPVAGAHRIAATVYAGFALSVVWASADAALALTVATAAAVAGTPAPRRVWPTWTAPALAVLACWAWLAQSSVEWVEAYTLPLAAFAAYVGWRARDRAPSIVTDVPALLLLLGPSLALALTGEQAGPRLTAVVVLATIALLDSARRRRQGGLVVAASALAVVAVQTLGPSVRTLPAWSVMVACGAVLLWVGFTWERRRDQARHATDRFREWA